MLSSLLSPSDCASCRFCCSYRRVSLWETPTIDPELLEKLKTEYPSGNFRSSSWADSVNKMLDYARKNPVFIRDYREEYIIIMEA